MKKTEKYYVPLPTGEVEFQKLFDFLVISGIGMPLSRDGGPIGAWTPDLITEAMSSHGESQNDVDLRTVQLWFQDNGKGVSPKNIGRLAVIFGCGDPNQTAEIRLKLTSAQIRLEANRRAYKKKHQSKIYEQAAVGTMRQPEIKKASSSLTPAFRTLAEKVEWMLSGSRSMNLQIL